MYSDRLKRREFMTLLGGVAAWPLAARAQQPAMPVIGFLNHGSAEGQAPRLRAFELGLSQFGYAVGGNIAIEYRWANNDVNLLPELANDLVRRRVAVIVTPISTPGALAAKAATRTIPIVFGVGTDPVQVGLVASFNRPGGNLTGICTLNWELGAKRIGLLQGLLPKATRFAVLVNPTIPAAAGPFVKDVESAAAVAGVQIEILDAATIQDIDRAFTKLAERHADALLVSTDTLFNNRTTQIVVLAARHAMPAMYPWQEAVSVGGLMSYGPDLVDMFREMGVYTARILKGEKPEDLPVARASKFNFVINLSTAKAMGISPPAEVLALADEVIE
jgi:putative ABC transport system substrate-binding protein